MILSRVSLEAWITLLTEGIHPKARRLNGIPDCNVTSYAFHEAMLGKDSKCKHESMLEELPFLVLVLKFRRMAVLVRVKDMSQRWVTGAVRRRLCRRLAAGFYGGGRHFSRVKRLSLSTAA